MKRDIKCIQVIFLAVLLTAVCCACGQSGTYDEADGMMLKDVDPNGMNTVWLSEDGVYVPYAVVDKKYDGKVLLIRQEPLEDEVPYRNEKVFGSGGGYYPGSDVDLFLNGEYFERLGQDVRDAIEDSKIRVTSEDTVTRGDNRRNTEEITRKVFLLSVTEMGDVIGGTSMAAKEGSAIKNLEQYITGNPEWLRSAYLWDDVHAWSISDEAYGEEAIATPLRVRPAFTMSRDMQIVPVDPSIAEKGYMLCPVK